jgi:hypothetical protein
MQNRKLDKALLSSVDGVMQNRNLDKKTSAVKCGRGHAEQEAG